MATVVKNSPEAMSGGASGGLILRHKVENDILFYLGSHLMTQMVFVKACIPRVRGCLIEMPLHWTV